MRQYFSEIVEAGRDRSGRYASLPRVRYGRFVVRHPRSGNLFGLVVADGEEWETFGLPLPAWEHVSASLVAGDRLPTWKELCWIKDLFWEPEECVVEFHSPQSKYINQHEMVLHLWRIVGQEFPMPPLECV